MSPTERYMALFNEIDKYLDQLLGADKFMPYNEKLKLVAHGSYPASTFVRVHRHTLKYFGELRNMLSHGLKLDGKTYAIPSDYAIEHISEYKDAILTPPTAGDLFAGRVYHGHAHEHVAAILKLMHQHHISHVPIFGQEEWLGVVTLEQVVQLWERGTLIDPTAHRIDQLDLHAQQHLYRFVAADCSVYELEQLFEDTRKDKLPLEAVFLTRDGHPSTQLLGMVTASDLPLIMSKVLLRD